MAQLNIEEQEQLDQFKAIWKRYGNFALLLLISVLGTYVAWNQWQSYQQGQSLQASAMYDELDKAVLARDVTRAAQVFGDLKTRYPKTFFAQQAALLLGKLQLDSSLPDDAQASLAWANDNATTGEYKALARLRLAAVLMESKKFDEALRLLAVSPSPAFEGLIADRRGDVLSALEKPTEAITAYQQAWKALDTKLDYRRVVEGKLGALGVSVSAEPMVAASGAAR